MSPNAPVILLVEDVPPHRLYLRGLLNEFGYASIIEAGDGREGLGVLATREVDLVITDFSMQPLSGLDMLRITREHLKMASLPFVMITAVGDEATLSQAERYGISGYLKKPVHIDLLRRSVANALSGQVPTSLADKYGHLRPAVSRANDEIFLPSGNH